jgi:hypothetical protein
MFTKTQRRNGLSDMQAVSIRTARPADAIAIARLAAYDSSHSPRGEVLLAEVDGELWAALSLNDGHAISDPFRRSGGALELLRARAAHVEGEKSRLRALRPRLAA